MSSVKVGESSYTGRSQRKRNTRNLDFQQESQQEEKNFQQALKISKLETKRFVEEIPECKVYYPTQEEFLDPLIYIQS